MNRRYLLAAALGLPLAPIAAMAAPLSRAVSPNWLRNAYLGVPKYEVYVNCDMGQPDDTTALALCHSDRGSGWIKRMYVNGELVWEAPKDAANT